MKVDLNINVRGWPLGSSLKEEDVASWKLLSRLTLMAGLLCDGRAGRELSCLTFKWLLPRGAGGAGF